MANFYGRYPVSGGSSGGVTSLNSETGDLTITAGTGIAVTTPTSTTIQIASTSAGDVSLAAIGSSPNANGATLTGQVLNLEPASASFGGVVTTGTQSLAGDKTFTGNVGVGISPIAGFPFTVGASSTGDLAVFKNTSASGFADNVFKDSAGTSKLAMGYGNASTASPFTSKNFIQTINTDLQVLYGASGTTIGLYFQNSTGNLGIGTNTTPSQKLEVTGTAKTISEASTLATTAGGLMIQRSTNDSVLYQGFRTTPDAWVVSATYQSTGAFKPLTFATSDTERMRIDTSGNVGIGTTSPDTPLTVVSTNTTTTSFAAADAIRTALTVNPASASGAFFTGVDNTVSMSGTQNLTGRIYGTTNTVTFNSTGTGTTVGGLLNNVTIGASAGAVTNAYGLSNSIGYSGTTTQALISGEFLNPVNSSSGTVTTARGLNVSTQNASTGTIGTLQGVYVKHTQNNASGTISNAYGLYVDSPFNSGTISNSWGVYVADTTAKNFLASNTGIGYNSPQALLHIDAGTATASSVKFTANTTTGRTSTDGFDVGIDSSGNAELRQRENLVMNFLTNNTQAMQIDASQKVGIGTTPAALFHVSAGSAGAVTTGPNTIQIFEGPGSRYMQFKVPTASSSGLLFGDTGAYDRGQIIYRNSTASPISDIMDFVVNSATAMRINSSGYVAIGTTTAASSLHVQGSYQGKVSALSADTTLDATYNIITMDDSGAAKTITLPAASSTIIGRTYRIKKMSASNTTTIARAGSDTIDGATSFVLRDQYQTVDIVCLTSTTWGVF